MKPVTTAFSLDRQVYTKHAPCFSGPLRTVIFRAVRNFGKAVVDRHVVLPGAWRQGVQKARDLTDLLNLILKQRPAGPLPGSIYLR